MFFPPVLNLLVLKLSELIDIYGFSPRLSWLTGIHPPDFSGFLWNTQNIISKFWIRDRLEDAGLHVNVMLNNVPEGMW
jgi:hypothetical protein